MSERTDNLKKYAQGIFREENGMALYEQYKEDIAQVTPKDIFTIQSEQLTSGMIQAEMLTYVDKLMNMFHKGLEAYEWETPEEGSFLWSLMEENRLLEKRMTEMQQVFKRQCFQEDKEVILAFFEELTVYNIHLQKIENIVFPMLEKKDPIYHGVSIMWSLHDVIRVRIRELKELFSESTDFNFLNRQVGYLYIDLAGLVLKQNLILFPCTSDELSKEDMVSMLDQSFEYGFVYMDPPARPEVTAVRREIPQGTIDMGTGVLTTEQLIGLVSALPVDLTFVDANDKVAFFSRPAERIFQRSIAVIGRDVRNCHPAESVHVVEDIIKNFKNGSRQKESFWIRMKGMFILIQYFAVRGDAGEYLGTLEVSQEISEIQSLQGEKRLLD